jgi:hypothetical protein
MGFLDFHSAYENIICSLFKTLAFGWACCHLVAKFAGDIQGF